MTALLKNQISPQAIEKLAELIKHELKGFDDQRFIKKVLTQNWQSMALKQRIRQVSQVLSMSLEDCLPNDYPAQVSLLLKIHQEFDGLFHFIFPDYIEINGLNHLELSLTALAEMTKRSTAEFAIRPFLEKYPEQTREFLIECSMSDDEHLRRLASEGVRPRLPWAKRLHWIDNKPDWVLTIISNLKTDKSRYVQTSVANLLNDLSKENPQWVLTELQSWELTNSESRWIAKHALRTLLKKGNVQALTLLGYPKAEHVRVAQLTVSPEVVIGEKLNFNLLLAVSSESSHSLGLLRIEYAISFLRKTQKPYRKVFKLSESVINAQQKNWDSSHNFKRISTRQYVAGKHRFEIIVNGQTVATEEFLLID